MAKRTRNLFIPDATQPFKLSRTKIELFVECPRCFYLDRRLGISRPPGFPFTLNSAVDHLLKKEFDFHRAAGSAHPLMKTYGVDAVPFKHDNMDQWRQNFVGVQHLHKPTNLIIFGAVDDVWVDPEGQLIVVDYKATSTNGKVSIDDEYKIAFKRQMEVYQWLLRQLGHRVSARGYFVYANARKDKEAFNAKLEFDVDLIPYVGNDDWVEPTIIKAHECLMSSQLPEAAPDCNYCSYREEAREYE